MQRTKRPVLLLDVMNTIVAEPIFKVAPEFFGMSLEELYKYKSYDAYVDFERGEIGEEEYGHRFFTDGRSVDVAGLRKALSREYAYLEGTEELLHNLHKFGYEIHALSNYGVWYEEIEARLTLSQYMNWTFVSCKTGLRKPDPQAYLRCAQDLQVSPGDCLFVDDRKKNTDGALAAGMRAILRNPKDTPRFVSDLRASGLEF